MDDKNIIELLGDEIKAAFDELSQMDKGSDEYNKAVDSLAKLYKLRIEDLKNEWEYSDRFNRHEVETQQLTLKAEAEKEQRKIESRLKIYQAALQGADFLFKHGIEIGLGLGTLYLQYYFLDKGFEFEKEGIYKSSTFRGIFPKFKSKR